MKEITKIRINNLKNAEYMTLSIVENCGHVFIDRVDSTFNDMLDIMLISNDIDDAVEILDIPVMHEIYCEEEFQVDETKEHEEHPMTIIRIK